MIEFVLGILFLVIAIVSVKRRSSWSWWISWIFSTKKKSDQIEVVKHYKGIDPEALRLKQGRSGRCLLSLDGGGARGFSQLFILEELANRTMHDLGLLESPPLCDYFDMIGGMGTGGYLAILTGCLGLTVPQLIACTSERAVSSDELDGFLKAVVKRYTGDSETLMFDPESPTSHCKTFVGAITTGNMSYLTNFRSYDTRDQPLDIPIWQAARATLAHPNLFPPAHVSSNIGGQVYISGEIGWKNPINEVIREFEALWPSQSIACLASIGSGHEGVIQIDGSSVSESMVAAMERIATDCEKIADEVTYRFQGRNTYFRLSVQQGLQQNITHQPLTPPDIQSLTKSYLRSAEASDTANKLVASILHTIEVSPWTTTREQFETSLDQYISRYNELVEGIPVASVKLSVQEGVLLLENIRTVKYSEERWLVFAKTFDNHLNSMDRHIFTEHQEPLPSNPLWVSIKDYFTEVKLVRKKLQQLLMINPHRIWGPPTHDTFLSKATKDLNECFIRITNAVLNDIHDRIVSAKRDARFDKLISWISRLDMDKRHQDIKNWLANEAGEASRALFGFGDPGAGKTFICFSAIEHLNKVLDRRRAALGRIYLDFRDEDDQDVCAVLGELSKQLLLQASSVPNEVWTLFDENFKITIDKARRIFTLLLRSFDSTYICIDALDECKPQSQREILGFLGTFKDSSLRIFCTGRFSVQDEAMKQLRPFITETMEIFAHESDVRQYLEAKIAEDPYEEAMDEQLKDEITSQLVSLSQKLFILPARQLQFILEHVTKRQCRNALLTIPKKLFELYDVTFERIQQQPETRVEMAKCILSWIYYAPGTLYIAEIRHALAVQPGDMVFDGDGIPSEKALRDCCLGLVVIEQETSIIRLSHLTLQEYLNNNLQQLRPYRHSTIASICLTYLNFEHPNFSWQTPYDPPPLLPYASHYVDYHLRHETNSELDNKMLELITNEAKVQLLQRSLDVPDSSDHPLHWAAYFGIASLAALVMRKADHDIVNIPTDDKETALTIAAKFGHEAVVRLLLETPGVEVDTRDEPGRTPLSYAAEHGSEVVVKLLLDTKGVGVNSKDDLGRAPLAYAAQNGRDAVVELLLHAEGVKVNLKDKSGRTPLSHAAENGTDGVIRLLLGAVGMKPDLKDKSGRTPLSYAARRGSEEIVRLLLDTDGVEADSRSTTERTPLSYAAQQGNEALVELLLGTGRVDADSRDKTGQTPLSHAASEGNEAVVKLLLARDVDVNSKDEDGFTPLTCALFRRHGAVVKALVDAGGVEGQVQRT